MCPFFRARRGRCPQNPPCFFVPPDVFFTFEVDICNGMGITRGRMSIAGPLPILRSCPPSHQVLVAFTRKKGRVNRCSHVHASSHDEYCANHTKSEMCKIHHSTGPQRDKVENQLTPWVLQSTGAPKLNFLPQTRQELRDHGRWRHWNAIWC